MDKIDRPMIVYLEHKEIFYTSFVREQYTDIEDLPCCYARNAFNINFSYQFLIKNTFQLALWHLWYCFVRNSRRNRQYGIFGFSSGFFLLFPEATYYPSVSSIEFNIGHESRVFYRSAFLQTVVGAESSKKH